MSDAGVGTVEALVRPIFGVSAGDGGRFPVACSLLNREQRARTVDRSRKSSRAVMKKPYRMFRWWVVTLSFASFLVLEYALIHWYFRLLEIL